MAKCGGGKKKKKGFLGHKNDDKRLHNKLYYVTLYDSTGGLALSQEEVWDKENENKACVRLINLFDLNGCMVTADALNIQRSPASAPRIKEREESVLPMASDMERSSLPQYPPL